MLHIPSMKSIATTPVGAVIAFAGSLGEPEKATISPIEAWGWMLCDGRKLRCSEYPELYATLGYHYGGSGDTFNIPDYRGCSLQCSGKHEHNVNYIIKFTYFGAVLKPATNTNL